MPAQIAAVAELIGERVGGAGLDGLVNNAGIAVPSPLETIPIEDFRRQIEVNLTGQVAVTQAMLPLIRRAAGRIVFVSSIGGRIAFPLTGAYHAAKFGVEAVGDVFRRSCAAGGSRVSIDRAGLDRHPDLGARRADGRRDRRRAPARRKSSTGKAIESYRKAVRSTAERGNRAGEGRQGRSSTR